MLVVELILLVGWSRLVRSHEQKEADNEGENEGYAETDAEGDDSWTEACRCWMNARGVWYGRRIR